MSKDAVLELDGAEVPHQLEESDLVIDNEEDRVVLVETLECVSKD